MTFNNPPRYQTYILRFWEERNPDPDTPNAWRFSLEDAETHIRHVFQTLEGLVQFLQRHVDDL